MTRANLTKMTLAQLLDRYVEIALAQYEAIENEQYGKYNRLFDKMVEVDEELRARGPEARLALTTLYKHPNPQVRFNAAAETLAVAPRRARKVLEDIKARGEFPQAGDAGMMLLRLDRGIFKPT